MAKTDQNIVIFFKNRYYEVPSGMWKQPDNVLSKTLAQFAKEEVIDKGKDVGFVPKPTSGEAGGYSTVINLSAILDKVDDDS